MRVVIVLCLVAVVGCFAASALYSVAAAVCNDPHAPCADAREDAAVWAKTGLVVFGLTAVLAFLRWRDERRVARDSGDSAA